MNNAHDGQKRSVRHSAGELDGEGGHLDLHGEAIDGSSLRASVQPTNPSHVCMRARLRMRPHLRVNACARAQDTHSLGTLRRIAGASPRFVCSSVASQFRQPPSTSTSTSSSGHRVPPRARRSPRQRRCRCMLATPPPSLSALLTRAAHRQSAVRPHAIACTNVLHSNTTHRVRRTVHAGTDHFWFKLATSSSSRRGSIQSRGGFHFVGEKGKHARVRCLCT